MNEHLNYSKIAGILLKQDKPVNIHQLSLISGISKDELVRILDFFVGENFLQNGKDYEKIVLNNNAKK